MMVDDDDNNTVGAITSVNGDDDNTADIEMPVHDQLPTVEEYKAQTNNDIHDATRMEEESAELEANENGNDDGAPVHDQLPSVEEAKTNAGVSELTNAQKRLRCFGIAVAAALLLLVATIVPVVVLTQDNEGSGGSRMKAVTNYLGDLGVSDLAALRNEETPQYKAAKWIADIDGYSISIPKDPPLAGARNSFVERYVLAVLYFASGGPLWRHQMGFLSPRDHCSWNQQYLTQGGTILLGVNSCEMVANTNERFVSVIGLSKFCVVSSEGFGCRSGDDSDYCSSPHFPLLPALLFCVAPVGNELTGTFPKELKFLHALEVFVGHSNPGMTGNFPEGFRTLAKLRHVEVSAYGTIRRTKRN